MPLVRHAVREVLLEPVVVGEIEQRLAETDDLLQDDPLPVVERASQWAFTETRTNG